ncbi:molybdopterin synthase catalytic subunit-like [Magnolia sinica]|uniref:molybdopterin synthase catalytic subunit-like n=1 Tax=Magnolia sinica TaxID=86752 RepID=UPI00265AED08|nr:molybdopterin synthase catalytic subunit-like [Magnolia sinica]
MAATEDEKTLIEILDDPSEIDPNKYMNYVRAPQSGAIATFAGTTRDSFEGKLVVELRYEAYVPMAIRRLRSICSSARSSWKIDSIAVAHRLGSVPVGETSVFVAVSAVHRSDAMEACRYVIDEIKASVPIWKKEVYANGEVWKENAEFLERRLGLEMGAHDKGGCCGAKVKVGSVNEEAHDKGGCCGAKVKVGSASEAAHDKGGCCGAKVKVGSVNEEAHVRGNHGGM